MRFPKGGLPDHIADPSDRMEGVQMAIATQVVA
jgi:hypothetical protein